ncbi:MAG: helix-turn-helix domain-containing protein [FCB group bacterium]|jgi:hypothetical protein|nr:helix-turn-helix domain-containing protein [FCB group bacterium]
MNEYLTLPEAAARIPGHPHVSCVWRWCRRGVLSKSGERMRLTHSRVGRKLLVTEADLVAFFQRLAEADATYFDQRPNVPALAPPAPRGQRTEGQRQAAAEAARRRIKGAVA